MPTTSAFPSATIDASIPRIDRVSRIRPIDWQSQKTRSAKADAFPLTPYRVLFIEDDPVDVKAVERILKLSSKPQFQVTKVGTLLEGQKMLGRENFDVVLMDLMLPDARGIDAVEQLRIFDSNVPMVVLTGLEDEDIALHTIEKGAQDYLSKLSLTGQSLTRSLQFSITRQQKMLGLEDSSATDPLTGLPNRRGLEDRYFRCHQIAGHRGGNLLMTILDLDHFKAINDRHGHFVGDVVLQAFSERLRSLVRNQVEIVRFGGEEFLILQPSIDPQADANALAAWLRRIPHRPIRISDVTLEVSCSAGMISVRGAESWTEAYTRCDQQLYRAKQAGRNRSCRELV
ncbi:MAG: GGDEF domain-containing response regulator [Planctomycetota bacterium]